jgi:hypothetical protein
MINKRFQRVSTLALRTMQQWLAVEALPSPTLPPRVVLCGHCGDDFELRRDANGDLMPCPNCGKGWRDTSMPGEAPRFETYSAPETLRRVVALQRDPDAVAEMAPVAVVARRAVSARRETYAPVGSTIDRALTLQRARGQREPAAAPLRTMQAASPCERCGRRQCQCPPKAPDVLGIAVQHREAERAVQDAALREAYPVLRQW